jgi:hypothetical protein
VRAVVVVGAMAACRVLCVDCLTELVSRACVMEPGVARPGLISAPIHFDLRQDWCDDAAVCVACERVTNGTPHFVEESALIEMTADLTQQHISHSDATQLIHDIAWSAIVVKDDA